MAEGKSDEKVALTFRISVDVFRGEENGVSRLNPSSCLGYPPGWEVQEVGQVGNGSVLGKERVIEVSEKQRRAA